MDNPYNLFLDDQRSPKSAFLFKEKQYLVEVSKIPDGNWRIVRSYDEFVSEVDRSGMPETVSFDNDLHPTHYDSFYKSVSTGYFDWEFSKPKMGMNCLDFLIKKCKKERRPLPKIFIHTANPMAADEMRREIEVYQKWLGPQDNFILDNFSLFC